MMFLTLDRPVQVNEKSKVGDFLKGLFAFSDGAGSEKVQKREKSLGLFDIGLFELSKSPENLTFSSAQKVPFQKVKSQ